MRSFHLSSKQRNFHSGIENCADERFVQFSELFCINVVVFERLVKVMLRGLTTVSKNFYN